MARGIDTDFQLLREFISNYRLDGLENDTGNLSVIKSSHKSYLPFLQLWSICSEKADKNEFIFFDREVKPVSPEFFNLRETISDTGSGLFCCLHGAYKPGHMALRSSIENFLRFATAPFDSSALTTTSIYDLFGLARNVKPFSGSRVVYIDRLRSAYVELCKYTHSASLDHMTGLHALAHFPTFEKDAFQEWVDCAKNCMSSIGAVIVLGNPSIFIEAHYSAKELLELLIPQDVRLALLRGD